MEKTKKFMDLNRETAMRLWCKAYGKLTKTKDFAGREIAKGAYNDRNSKCGWNVDHILPQSKEGKTADHNLICCHILTNDEKADKFPCFSANGKRFEIVKVENHYEIKQKTKTKRKNGDSLPKTINYYDSASGIRHIRALDRRQNEPWFVGTVFIRAYGIKNTAALDFVEDFFEEENVSFLPGCRNNEALVVAKNYNMYSKDDVSKLLDKCVLLNTYFGHYFMPCNYLNEYDIYFRLDRYQNKTMVYFESSKTDIHSISANSIILPLNNKYTNALHINDLVYENTEAQDKVKKQSSLYTKYDFVFTKLSKNLDKEVKGK